MSLEPNYPLVADEAAHADNELDHGLWGRLSLLLPMPVNLWSVLAGWWLQPLLEECCSEDPWAQQLYKWLC